MSTNTPGPHRSARAGPRSTREKPRTRSFATAAWIVLGGLALECGSAPLEARLVDYRVEIESALDREPADPVSKTQLPLPTRRDRRLEVGDQRIGSFDFLATVGCPLSELVAARNAPLGKVLEPTRRLAHESAVLDAIEECLPTLGEERARRLRARAEAKRADLSAHVWNAVWLDDDLERYLSSGPATLVGRSDPADGPRQLSRAAEALSSLDVPALEAFLQALRDDPPLGPHLVGLIVAARELDRVAQLVASQSQTSESTRRDRCDDRARRLSRVFETRYATLQPAIAALDRNGREGVASLVALYRATARDDLDVPPAMQRFRSEILDDGTGVDLGTRFRTAVVDHGVAWSPVLEACGVIPGRPA